MGDTAKDSLVGRIVVSTGDDGRDVGNDFALVVAETETKVTLVRLDSQVAWEWEGSSEGLEKPRRYDDPAIELAACDRPLLGEKQFGERGVYVQAGGHDYYVWNGTPLPCRYL